MQALLANFLLKYGYCPIPGVGTLKLEKTAGYVDVPSRMVYPGRHEIMFTSETTKPKAFVQYAMETLHQEKHEVKQSLYHYADQINFLPAHGTKSFGGLGDFYREGSGKLFFKPNNIHSEYQPPRRAVKVAKQNASHPMVVGDRETNSADMNAYYADEKIVKRDNWWIAFLIILVISAILIYLHYTQYNGNSIFGNHT